MLPAFLKPPPALPPIRAEDAALRRLFRYWRLRQFYASFIGYAVFYFVRKNLPVAMPLMEKSLGIGKTQLGLFLTGHDLLYGVSKFLNGMVADRANPRYFMAIGLVLSALMNIGFGFGTGLITLGAFWLINGWFQGMGFPPCARILSNWLGLRERGMMWGLWNSSHQVGAALILVLSGVLGAKLGWRSIFWGPALIAVATSAFLVNRLRDTPGSLGLPRVEFYTGEVPFTAAEGAASREVSESAFSEFLRKQVFANPFLWALCGANFFVYLIRYGVLNWAPTYLSQVRGISLVSAGTLVAGFEIAGLVGSVLAGWLSDRFLRGRRAPLCVAYMLACVPALVAFWKLPAERSGLVAPLLFAIGFLIYGPQLLVGVMATDLVGPRAAATAIGLTGLFGYASSAVSGLGLGWIVEHFGWEYGFKLLVGSATLAAACFATAWEARPSPQS